ncbi:MAG: benzoyl-CoA-dihydrodiol lyase [Planctomycetes bacterium]|nr:benzoyl-CoA-dihydrodiol lyase [Planctomycetota bacterium]
METTTRPPACSLPLDTHPTRYRHWKLEVEPPLAWLRMSVAEDGGLLPSYKLKLNSYDLGVDIELADAVNRLRFEHPEVGAVIVTGSLDRCFCAGANIFMLASSPHPFKVNFCRFTNETRLAIEDASANSGQHYLCAANGICAGGGYELAMACDEILLVDDGSAAVSLPEVPLLGVLPGTGGLTRLVDKRKVRRDLADLFCTLAEGVKGKRAVEWGLVDAAVPKSRFDPAVRERALALAARDARAKGPGIVLAPISPEETEGGFRYPHVEVRLDPEGRTAELIVSGPQGKVPRTVEEVRAAGSDFWPLVAFRELDDALLRLRMEHEEIGLVLLKTRGELEQVLALDRILDALKEDWFVNEVRLLMARTLRRLDLTAKSFFALVEEGSCFAGCLLELALAADRTYMLLDDPGKVRVATSPLSAGAFPMTHGLSRLAVRFLRTPGKVEAVLAREGPFGTEEAEREGLVTRSVDEIDWEDEVRIAIEERASLSPDALTGMEANLRFPGPETAETKVFGRLSAWQNWIFQRPNATGESGALSLYGSPHRPRFDWRRT